MAFFDWNGNGKKDFFDDYVEYNIYKECTKDTNTNSNSNSSSSNSGCAFWFWLSVIMIILGLLSNCD